ncbi:hypothetical protein ACYSNO_06450 [Enterococcus sp. LJL98]
MKKICLVGLLFVSLGFTACKKNEVPTALKQNEQTQSSFEREEKTKPSSIHEEASLEQIDSDALIAMFTDYLSLFTFQDNMIGNISYNFTEDMIEQEFTSLKGLIEDYFIPERKKLLTLYETSSLELERLEWDENALQDLMTNLDAVVQQQNGWAEQIHQATEKNAIAIRKSIDNETEAYIMDSMTIGMNLSNLLLTSGFSETETSTIAQTALYEATKRYGDPTDLEAFDEPGEAYDEEALDEILQQLEEMMNELAEEDEKI